MLFQCEYSLNSNFQPFDTIKPNYLQYVVCVHGHGSTQLDTLLSQPLTVCQADAYLSDYAEIRGLTCLGHLIMFVRACDMT